MMATNPQSPSGKRCSSPLLSSVTSPLQLHSSFLLKIIFLLLTVAAASYLSHGDTATAPRVHERAGTEDKVAELGESK